MAVIIALESSRFLDGRAVWLDLEHEVARIGIRTWASRLALNERATRILVVSDTPEQDLQSNRRQERKRRDLDAGFSLTAPDGRRRRSGTVSGASGI